MKLARVYLFAIHVVDGRYLQNREALEVITNNIGGEKLVYAGHTYTIKSVSGSSKRWESSHRKGLTCNGKITTDLNVTRILSEVQHSHPSDPGKTETTNLKLEFKSKAKYFRGSMGQLMIDGIASSSPSCRMPVGRPDSLKWFIRRHVSQGRPKDPASLEELVISISVVCLLITSTFSFNSSLITVILVFLISLSFSISVTLETKLLILISTGFITWVKIRNKYPPVRELSGSSTQLSGTSGIVVIYSLIMLPLLSKDSLLLLE